MKAFIFDLDGTILDTLADIGASCNAVLQKHNYPTHPIEAYAHMVGNGFPKTMIRALPKDANLDDLRMQALVEEARIYYGEHMMEETMPYPGVTMALSMLAQAGSTLAILSNKPDELTKRLIAHFLPTISFAVVEGARPDLPLKPDPASVLAIIDRINMDKKDICYIGDSDVDIFTGRNAGIMPIGAGWGYRGAQELEKAGAEIVLGAPWELGELLLV